MVETGGLSAGGYYGPAFEGIIVFCTNTNSFVCLFAETQVFALETVNMFRKYTGLFDLLLSIRTPIFFVLSFSHVMQAQVKTSSTPSVTELLCDFHSLTFDVLSRRR